MTRMPTRMRGYTGMRTDALDNTVQSIRDVPNDFQGCSDNNTPIFCNATWLHDDLVARPQPDVLQHLPHLTGFARPEPAPKVSLQVRIGFATNGTEASCRDDSVSQATHGIDNANDALNLRLDQETSGHTFACGRTARSLCRRRRRRARAIGLAGGALAADRRRLADVVGAS